MGMTGITLSKMRQSGGDTVAGAQMYANAWPEHIRSEEDFYPTNPKYQKYILPDVKPIKGANYGTTVEERHGMYGNTQYKAGEVRNKPAQKEHSTPSGFVNVAAPRENVPNKIPLKRTIDYRPIRTEDTSKDKTAPQGKSKELLSKKKKGKGRGQPRGLLLDDEQQEGLMS